MNIPLAYSSVFLVVASLAIGFPAAAHGPSGHHETATAAHDEQAMKAQHERMGKFRTAKLAADAGTGNLQKTSLAYGRVLETCASCHAMFRD